MVFNGTLERKSNQLDLLVPIEHIIQAVMEKKLIRPGDLDPLVYVVVQMLI